MNRKKMTSFFNNIFPPEVITFVSRRPHDFSLSATQNNITEEQHSFLSGSLGLSLPDAANVRQVHGNKIVFIPEPKGYVAQKVLQEADGLFTDCVGLPLIIRTADCVPIFLYDPDQKRIGLIHAGWRGTEKRILSQSLMAMQASAKNIKIAFGPAIRPCCYEVGGDLLGHFPNETVQRHGKYYLDLIKANKAQADSYGVLKENIQDCGSCTCCDKNYFSYRREGNRAGRNISLMMLKKGQ